MGKAKLLLKIEQQVDDLRADSVVEHMSDRMLVMYFGEIMEGGGWRDISKRPLIPTRAG